MGGGISRGMARGRDGGRSGKILVLRLFDSSAGRAASLPLGSPALQRNDLESLASLGPCCVSGVDEMRHDRERIELHARRLTSAPRASSTSRGRHSYVLTNVVASGLFPSPSSSACYPATGRSVASGLPRLARRRRLAALEVFGLRRWNVSDRRHSSVCRRALVPSPDPDLYSGGLSTRFAFSVPTAIARPFSAFRRIRALPARSSTASGAYPN